MSEWKPGDVAWSSNTTAGALVFRTRNMRGEDVWCDQHGILGPDIQWATEPKIRPLVVIDPEDAEQIERLASAVVIEGRGHRIDEAIITVGLKKGLRELAAPTPSKPAEPQGLGAVVEDATGRRWVRVADADPTPWRLDGYIFREYPGVDAVRVLSEGVTP